MEMNPKQLESEKRLLKRLMISDYDLQIAEAAADQILARRLHSSPDTDDRVLLRCLNICLVVSYWRPFSGNDNAPDVLLTLPASYLKLYNEPEHALHERMKAIRNSEHAHSDPAASAVEIMVAPGPFAVPRSRDSLAPLSQHDVSLLKSMLEKLIGKIAEEQVRIQALLQPGDAF